MLSITSSTHRMSCTTERWPHEIKKKIFFENGTRRKSGEVDSGMNSSGNSLSRGVEKETDLTFVSYRNKWGGGASLLSGWKSLSKLSSIWHDRIEENKKEEKIIITKNLSSVNLCQKLRAVLLRAKTTPFILVPKIVWPWTLWIGWLVFVSSQWRRFGWPVSFFVFLKTNFPDLLIHLLSFIIYCWKKWNWKQ